MKEVFGILLFSGIVLAGVWYGPGWWRAHRLEQASSPSIAGLQSVATPSSSQGSESAPPTNSLPMETGKNPQETSKPVDKTKVQVKVLNGGATPGSAGKIAKTLQGAGFTLAKGSDAKGDYVGLAVYYLEGHQLEAEAVKTALGTGQTVAKFELIADTKQETGSAPVVVMLGK